MEKLVKQILGRRPPRRGRSHAWTENWGLKLLSLCFAIFLWYFVVGVDKVDMTVYVPIEIINLPRDLVISNQFKKQLEVTVSGPRGLIRGITNQDITRPIDLSKATPGTVVVRNDADSIPFPRGIKVLRIQPAQTIFLLDRLVQKEFPIKPIVVGSPPKGYKLGSIQLEPPTISVTGPQAVLGGQTLITDPIDVSGLTGPITKQVTLNMKPELADLIGEPVVTARINVQEKTVTRDIARVSVAASRNGPPVDYRIRPATVDIRAELPVGLLKNTHNLKSLFLAQVNLDDLPPGTHEVEVRVNATKEVKILKVSPAKVTVSIWVPRKTVTRPRK